MANVSFGLVTSAALHKLATWLSILLAGVPWEGLMMMMALEIVQKTSMWIIARLEISFQVTARISQSDPTYEWLIYYLGELDVWHRTTKDFIITASNGRHRADFHTFDGRDPKGQLIHGRPAPGHIQRFWWHGYWTEVSFVQQEGPYGENLPNHMIIRIVTRNTSVLRELCHEAASSYSSRNRESVLVRTVTMSRYQGMTWSTAQAKIARPLKSLIVDAGSPMEELLEGIRRFWQSEAWYQAKGIPYHCGYLLHGPPGSGKTSTIYTIAGHCNLPVYVISLSCEGMTDFSLLEVFNSVPQHAIIAIEDLDCAFPPPLGTSADDTPLNRFGVPRSFSGDKSTMVTLSGLLNVLDGLATGNGRIVFATTNHIERIDKALIRPGRFDQVIPYYMATQRQAMALFEHIFAENTTSTGDIAGVKPSDLATLGKEFAERVPQQQFSMAEIQGYLIHHRDNPRQAIEQFTEWKELQNSRVHEI